jgi:hypothetical protein
MIFHAITVVVIIIIMFLHTRANFVIGLRAVKFARKET